MSYIVANWKANLDKNEVDAFVSEWQALVNRSPLPADRWVGVAPTAIFYQYLRERRPAFRVGLQDLSPFAAGAYTGEVTSRNLRSEPPDFVILGHSERRREFGEINGTIVYKVQRAWELGSTPLVCFDAPEAADLSFLLQDMGGDKPLVLAYEPVSAISTSGSAGNLDPQDLDQAMMQFRALFPGTPILYGGSVKPDNAASYGGHCDGLLVGGASLQVESFWQIVQSFHSSTAA